MKKIDLRTIGVALIVDIGSTFIFSLLSMFPVLAYILSNYGQADVEVFSKSSEILMSQVPIAIIFTTLGGYIITKRCAENALLNVFVFCGLLAVWGLVNLIFFVDVPSWYLIVSIVGNVPVALIGYVLARKF